MVRVRFGGEESPENLPVEIAKIVRNIESGTPFIVFRQPDAEIVITQIGRKIVMVSSKKTLRNYFRNSFNVNKTS